MPSYLEKIINCKRKEVEQLISEKAANSEHYLNKIINQNYPFDSYFSSSLKGQNLAVIGEVKRRSPSCGEIKRISNPVDLALKYCKGGASVISVLTDLNGFGGSLLDIQQVSKEVKAQYPNVSILRKDFIIHPLQLAESVFFGANVVLLIVKVVGRDLNFLLKEAKRLGLEVLTEVHNLQELELALEAGASIIGINHRNLETFEIDLNISKHLKPLIPSHVITVAESGIRTPEEAQQMYELGFDAILVGEALVRSEDPLKLIELMKKDRNEN